MAEWPSFLKDDYKRQQFFQQIGRFGAGLLQGSNTYSRQPVNAWSYGANALGQSVPGPGEALQQQFLQEKLKTLQAARERQKQLGQMFSGSGEAKVGPKIGPRVGNVGTGVPPGAAPAAAGIPEWAVRMGATPITWARAKAIYGATGDAKAAMSALTKRPEGLPVGTRINPETGRVESMPGAEEILLGRKRAGATKVTLAPTLGFKPLSEVGKLQADYVGLRKQFGENHPATKAAKEKIARYGLSGKTKGEIEKSIVDARAGLERIRGIAKQFDPSFQTFPTRALNWTRAMREKLGVTLSPQEQEGLTKFTTFQRETIQNLNLYIRAITGAQLSEHEAGRIMKGMPNLDDSPTQFKAKLDSTIRELDAALARASGQRGGTLTGRPRSGPRTAPQGGGSVEDKYKKWLK